MKGKVVLRWEVISHGGKGSGPGMKTLKKRKGDKLMSEGKPRKKWLMAC